MKGNDIRKLFHSWNSQGLSPLRTHDIMNYFLNLCSVHKNRNVAPYLHFFMLAFDDSRTGMAKGDTETARTMEINRFISVFNNSMVIYSWLRVDFFLFVLFLLLTRSVYDLVAHADLMGLDYSSHCLSLTHTSSKSWQRIRRSLWAARHVRFLPRTSLTPLTTHQA
jgi:hypothetical protein